MAPRLLFVLICEFSQAGIQTFWITHELFSSNCAYECDAQVRGGKCSLHKGSCNLSIKSTLQISFPISTLTSFFFFSQLLSEDGTVSAVIKRKKKKKKGREAGSPYRHEDQGCSRVNSACCWPFVCTHPHPQLRVFVLERLPSNGRYSLYKINGKMLFKKTAWYRSG